MDHGPSTLEEEAAAVRARLEATVESHLMSDVPLGLFLSGGLDSTGLAALMARRVKEPIRTYAVGFTERAANELSYARLAARSAGAPPRAVTVPPEGVFTARPRRIW